MEVILDTSFILTCLKEKIDFLDADEFGNLLLPEQVLNELIKIAERRGKYKETAKLALQIINKNKEKFKFIKLEKKYADSGIIKYVQDNKVIVATIDKNLKKHLKGKAKILIIRARKKLDII